MDSILVVWLLPELLPLAFLLLLVILWLMDGGLERCLPHAKPRSNRVAATYWGGYQSVSGTADSDIALPRISPIREPVKWEKDWTGG